MFRFKRIIIYTGIIAIVIPAVIFLKLFSYSNLVLHPKKPSLNNFPSHWNVYANNPQGYGLKYESASFLTSGGLTLRGWFIPGKLQKGIILVHGFEANRAKMLKYCRFLNEAGYNILLFDLRYFGESQGEFCSMGYNEKNDIKAAINFLESKGINDIGIIAESMGGVAVILALEDKINIRCVVLDSVFSDLKKLILYTGKKDKHLSQWIAMRVVFIIEKRLRVLMEQLSASKAIKKTHVPVYVICGRGDQRVPFSQCEEIYASANDPKFFWETDCAHAQSFNVYPRDYEDKILGFFNKYL